MNNGTNLAAPTSHENLTKMAKEKLSPKLTKLQKMVNKIKAPLNYKSGIDEPCNFGSHNINFDNKKSIW